MIKQTNMTDTDILLKHPRCPCDECWCASCVSVSVNNSNKIKAEIESKKQKFINGENNKLKLIADGIRKKHRIVYRFKHNCTGRISHFYHGIFSSYENVEKFVGSRQIEDDIVVIKSDKVSDEDIVELDKSVEKDFNNTTTFITHNEYYGC